MQASSVAEARSLTKKGEATRARILEATASLVYAHGVHATNNEQVRRAARVSGSQLNHYFPTKESLVLAVIQWQADRVLDFHRSDRFGGFDSVASFREWADFYVGYERSCIEGCRLGSLASEVIKTELHVREQLASAFVEWHDVFRDGLEAMKARNDLEPNVDTARLANLVLAAFQGGMLLSQVARDSAPLRDALHGAIDLIDGHTAESA